MNSFNSKTFFHSANCQIVLPSIGNTGCSFRFPSKYSIFTIIAIGHLLLKKVWPTVMFWSQSWPLFFFFFKKSKPYLFKKPYSDKKIAYKNLFRKFTSILLSVNSKSTTWFLMIPYMDTVHVQEVLTNFIR